MANIHASAASAILEVFDEVSLVIKRREELLSSAKVSVESLRSFGQGKLLVYEPSLTMVDNISGFYTDGFFDDVDAPPWDLWVDYVVDSNALQVSTNDPACRDLRLDFLVSYIPATLVPLVEKGVWANTAACLRWLDLEGGEPDELLNAVAAIAKESFAALGN